jgi:putative nucleotidyltransferase with HDIG domain
VLFAGCGVAVGQLREMRHRSSLIQASGITATVLAVATLLVGLLETPMVSGAARQILLNGFWAGLSGFAVGFVVLGMLPTLERWFDITTGMTLAELRDPKQPLLRQLQQKAPGTYNHSLQVANIAEAAAETIGANGLLVYVGALYHDIGKMNKPEYFVENQTQGSNKHDKLSPAMSLLVIIGHIKDGMELAREYGLPRSIQHFIDTHHGTTLVEYFYHAARARREGEQVAEIEFRYPGPKPRTREAAILMLADAVESAARTLSDPNPSRIEGLVRHLSRKRLTDGQYDQCDLSFRELTMVEESVVKSLCAIYHGRISYPSQKEESRKTAAVSA